MQNLKRFHMLIMLINIYLSLFSRRVVPENMHTPHPPQRALLPWTPPPWTLHPRGCMSNPPPPPFTPPPGIPVIFQLGWVPSGKNICVKNVFARYYKFSWDKMKKYIFSFMLIWCLIISRTFFVNNQPQRRCLTQTTRITSSAKEPVTFKLNTT